MKRIGVAVVGFALAAGLAACGEHSKSQVAGGKCRVAANGTVEAVGRLRNPEAKVNSYTVKVDVIDDKGTSVGTAAGSVAGVPPDKDKAFVLTSVRKVPAGAKLRCQAWEIGSA